jgi:hypothetical protein
MTESRSPIRAIKRNSCARRWARLPPCARACAAARPASGRQGPRFFAQLATFAQLCGNAFNCLDQVAAGFRLQRRRDREKADLGSGHPRLKPRKALGKRRAHADLVVAAAELAKQRTLGGLDHDRQRTGHRMPRTQAARKDVKRLWQLFGEGGAIAGLCDPNDQAGKPHRSRNRQSQGQERSHAQRQNQRRIKAKHRDRDLHQQLIQAHAQAGLGKLPLNLAKETILRRLSRGL